ncbi:MAG TPA: T9SS type A sorting domain-containing protein, partial [Cryomorphaceae bacterium]|nr:T9SS type A sorting domain-containing protein [Cryomorphaceae bacterium]
NITDTIYIGFTNTGTEVERPQQISYTWISPEAGGVVAEAIFIDEAFVSFRYLNNLSALSSTEIAETDFQIYPNPASKSLEITIPSDFSGEFKILDLTGREVSTGQLKSNISIDISKLPEGIYLVSAYSSMNVLTKRLIVNR